MTSQLRSPTWVRRRSDRRNMTKAAAGHHDRLIVKRIGQRGGDRRAVSTRAITDRVPERGRLLALDGPSVRTLHVNLDDAMKENSDQQTVATTLL